MEWVNGFKVNDVQRIQCENLDLKDVDLKLFNMFAEQIFHTGFVHADPHPGNGNYCIDRIFLNVKYIKTV